MFDGRQLQGRCAEVRESYGVLGLGLRVYACLASVAVVVAAYFVVLLLARVYALLFAQAVCCTAPSCKFCGRCGGCEGVMEVNTGLMV